MILSILIFTFLFFVFECGYLRLADRFNWVDKPNLRSSHVRPTIIGGGVLFLFAAIVYAIDGLCLDQASFSLTHMWPFLIGLLLIGGISYLDDLRPVKNRIRIVVQTTAMCLLFYQWYTSSELPLWILPFGLIFCIGTMNAYNFMDGINGITVAYSSVVLGTLYYLNTQFVLLSDHYFIIMLIAIGVLAFFNFRRRARCFGGDVGTISLSYIVLLPLGLMIIKTSDLTYFVLLTLYGVDTINTLIHRLILRQNIFRAHRRHAFQLLVNEGKLPHLTVASIYAFIQLLINVVYLRYFEGSWIFFVGVIILFSACYWTIVRKLYPIHLQYLAERDAADKR